MESFFLPSQAGARDTVDREGGAAVVLEEVMAGELSEPPALTESDGSMTGPGMV